MVKRSLTTREQSSSYERELGCVYYLLYLHYLQYIHYTVCIHYLDLHYLHYLHIDPVWPQFFILHRRWGLALDCLDRVLARPRDEEEEWRPCAESLLLRARVRLATADTAGALHDAQFVADTTRDNEGRAARAMVLKAQVLILFVPNWGE